MISISKLLVISFFHFLGTISKSQNNKEDLPGYYPSPNDEPLTFKLMVHVFHYKKDDPKNFILADTVIIQKHFENMNSFRMHKKYILNAFCMLMDCIWIALLM